MNDRRTISAAAGIYQASHHQAIGKDFLDGSFSAAMNIIFGGKSAAKFTCSDCAGFGRLAVRRCATIEAWEATDWKSIYASAGLQVSVNLRLVEKG